MSQESWFSVTSDGGDGDDGSSLSNYLENNYIGSDGGIQWGDLSGAIIGGLLTAVSTGVITIQQAFGAIVDEGLQPIEDVARNGGDEVAAAIVDATDVWAILDLGPLTLPVNAAFVLLAMLIVVVAIRRARQ